MKFLSDNLTKKVQKRFNVKTETIEFLEDYAYRNNIPYASVGTAIDELVQEYQTQSNNGFQLNYVVDQVSNKVTQSVQIALKQSISEEIKRVRLGTNNTDRNTQILIELLQGYMQSENIKHIINTDDNMPPFLEETKELIHERITKQKQKKDSK